jgi:pyruvate/2-oxoglutarate dehydrogenase complex dihydrolipoamide acyltransferase (E2) component
VRSSHTEGGVHPARGPAEPDAAAEDPAGIQVLMPQMGVSVAEGTIVEWRKRPGDWVNSDEALCDVTTDKVDVEIPAPADGRLERILVEAGATVPVGTPLARIDPAARPGEAHPEEKAPNGGGERSAFFSPVVLRMAEKHGVDLSLVSGTGVGGRVRKQDVLAYLELRQEADSAAPPEPALHIESPYRPEDEPPESESDAFAAPPSGHPAGPRLVEELAPGRREPMSAMRQAIARHMVESRHVAAHCTTIVEADFSRVGARRAELRQEMERRGVNLTYLAFVALATVEALQAHPKLNASVDGEEIVYHDDVNLGIAVALEDGLIVPVIRQAQRLSLEGIAATIADLAERARSRRLEPDEVNGGTFTITNPGQFGAVLATPIINQPQVAILDLEAIVKRPVIVQARRLQRTASGGDAAAEGAEEAIAIHPVAYLCMSWDHRALDGADAARFLAAIKGRLERWEARRA